MAELLETGAVGRLQGYKHEATDRHLLCLWWSWDATDVYFNVLIKAEEKARRGKKKKVFDLVSNTFFLDPRRLDDTYIGISP